jgi:hypothetical protein
MGDAAVEDEDAGNWDPRAAAIAAMATAGGDTDLVRAGFRNMGMRHSSSVVLRARIRFSICRRYASS